MYKQCRTEQSAARQRELERGLLRIMSQRHYDEISVIDLCKELDIPRKAFYRYFDSKDGALFALIDHTLMDYDGHNQWISGQKNASAQEYMEWVFRYWVENRELLDALSRSGLTGILVQRAIEHARKMDKLPFFTASSDRLLQDYATMFAVCGLMSMITQWHHDGFVRSPEEMAMLAIHLFREPLLEIGYTE